MQFDLRLQEGLQHVKDQREEGKTAGGRLCPGPRSSDRGPEPFGNLVTASAAAAAAATASATATAAASAVTTAAAATLRLGARFVHVEGSAPNFLPVDGVDCTLTLRVIRHFDEGEASGLSGVTIRNDVDAIHTAMLLKKRTNVLLGG
jgi:hypothetical protein